MPYCKGTTDVCQDTDDIPCFGPTEADCLSLGCCWEPPNCVHSNGLSFCTHFDLLENLKCVKLLYKHIQYFYPIVKL